MNLQEITLKEYENILALLREFAPIPAPSGQEDLRAKWCLAYFKKLGIHDAYIDDAKNVVCILGDKSKDISLFMAHTDVVFGDLKSLPYSEDDKVIRCPGIGDDTACLAIMLVCVKYIVENNIPLKNTLMFVANSCEEGLGNLRGCRKIFDDYGKQIKEMYTFDGMYDKIVNKSVGSHRYQVVVKTEGGHSFNDFGKTNAISVLAEMICKIEAITVPVIGDSKTTFNIGTVSGGTSVNTIAQEAESYVEYRSDHAECLAIMEGHFKRIFEETRKKCEELIVERVGVRPCGENIDETKLQEMTRLVYDVQKKHTGLEIIVNSGSTDCNIPHSLGIPAICVGVYEGGGAHTREEWLYKESLKEGFMIALELILTAGGIEV